MREVESMVVFTVPQECSRNGNGLNYTRVIRNGNDLNYTRVIEKSKLIQHHQARNLGSLRFCYIHVKYLQQEIPHETFNYLD